LSFAEKIYILEISEKLLADKISQEKVKSSGKAEIIFQAKTLEIKGKNMVESLVYQDKASQKELKVEGVFIRLGLCL